jgi:RNA polymerase sigma-70 factor (ECF subfamily)
LYAIAVNKCRTQFRRRALPMISLQENNPEHTSASSSPSVTDRIEASELTKQVDAIVRSLPEQQRTVLVMRVWGGLSYSGIAEAVGLR